MAVDDHILFVLILHNWQSLIEYNKINNNENEKIRKFKQNYCFSFFNYEAEFLLE